MVNLITVLPARHLRPHLDLTMFGRVDRHSPGLEAVPVGGADLWNHFTPGDVSQAARKGKGWGVMASDPHI